MGQVAAMVQVHAQYRVPRLAQGHVDGVVGLGAGVGLHVGKLRAEELAGPLNGQVLHDVHALAAAVVPLAGVAFRILVGEHAARRGQYRLGHDVLRGDQFDVVALALILLPDGLPRLGVEPLHEIHVL